MLPTLLLNHFNDIDFSQPKNAKYAVRMCLFQLMSYSANQWNFILKFAKENRYETKVITRSYK